MDTNTETPKLESQSAAEDLEKGDHAVPQSDVEKTSARSDESPGMVDDTISGDPEDDSLSRPTTNVWDDEDPFALFPRLSVSMSSTRGPWIRRNTTTTLGRHLTREETMQTIKSVRSRFTEARSEFDENVYLSSINV
jgi:hypothetical protein